MVIKTDLFSKLNVTWKPPSDPNGIITGYYITWKMTEDDNNMSTPNPTSFSEFTIKEEFTLIGLG